MSLVPVAVGVGALDALILAEALAAWREYINHPRKTEPPEQEG
jgi:hypothetical protein